MVYDGVSSDVNLFAKGKSSAIKSEEKDFVIKPGEDVNIFSSDVPGRIVGIELDGGTSFEGLQKDIIISGKWVITYKISY